MVPYFAYLASCADGTLYAGITTDPARRIVEHNGSARGAKYTRARRPVRLAYAEPCPDRSSAQQRECQLRRLTRQEKQALADLFIAENQS